MVNYNQGKIYRIVPNCEHEPHEVYIGSTTKQYLSQRMVGHRRGYIQWKEGKASFTRSYILFDKYGVYNCSIILIENVNAQSKEELLKKERENIEKNPCVNVLIPFRTNEEHTEYRKVYIKQYNHENKESLKQQTKIYRDLNREIICQRKREFYERNKENVLNQQKEYYETKKDAILDRVKKYNMNSPHISCGCGSLIKKCRYSQHIKTEKHQAFICQTTL